MSFILEQDLLKKYQTAGKVLLGKSSTSVMIAVIFYYIASILIEGAEGFAETLEVKAMIGGFSYGISIVLNLKELRTEKMAKITSRVTSFMFTFTEIAKVLFGEEIEKLMEKTKTHQVLFSPTAFMNFVQPEKPVKTETDEETQKDSKPPTDAEEAFKEENKGPFPPPMPKPDKEAVISLPEGGIVDKPTLALISESSIDKPPELE